MKRVERKNKTIFTELSADFDELVGVYINFLDEVLSIEVRSVDKDGVEKKRLKPLIYKDEPQSKQAINESLTVRDGQVKLSHLPLSDLQVVHKSIILEYDDRFVIDADIIKFNQVANGQTVNVSYMRLLPAKMHVASFLSGKSNRGRSDSIQEAALKILIDDGIIEGKIK